MPSSTVYAKVDVADDDDDKVGEINVDANKIAEIDVEASPSPSPSPSTHQNGNSSSGKTEKKRPLCCKPCIFILGTLFGIVVGRVSVTGSLFGMKIIDVGHHTAIDNDVAVSYNFLRTTKGSQTMRLLLDDLIMSPDDSRQLEEITSSTTSSESVQSQPDSESKHSATTSSSSTIDVYEDLSGGPRRALTHLQKLMKSDGQIFSSCHPLAHNLGRVAYQLHGSYEGAYDGLLESEPQLLRLCNAAFLHGVLEYHLRSVSIDKLVDEANEINKNVCTKMFHVDTGAWECHHGIGHGIIQRFRMDAPTMVIAQSMNVCKQTSRNGGCENGLWMDHFAVSGNIRAMDNRLMAADVVETELQNAIAEKDDTDDLVQTEKDVDMDLSAVNIEGLEPETLQICNMASSGNSYDCMIYAATEYLLVKPRDYSGAMHYCNDLSANIEPSQHQTCVNGVAIQCAKENMSDFSVVEKLCEGRKARDDEHPDDAKDGKDTCFQQALNYFRMSSGNAPGYHEKDLCNNLTTFKQQCLKWAK